MTMDNHEIVRLLGMGITWEGIEREAERRKLAYRRPCCADCGAELSIEEVVRDATYCYSCEERLDEEARRKGRESGTWSDDGEDSALYGLVALARVLPVPWLIPVGLAVAAAFGLAHRLQSKRTEGAAVQVSDTG